MDRKGTERERYRETQAKEPQTVTVAANGVQLVSQIKDGGWGRQKSSRDRETGVTETWVGNVTQSESGFLRMIFMFIVLNAPRRGLDLGFIQGKGWEARASLASLYYEMT